ncbi:hypothetical protein SERLA73DRAFT_146817, partial [Serpula lacrymans var. lacrymans S7.3]
MDMTLAPMAPPTFSPRGHLLPEIWLGVFNQLPRQNIRDVTLTCHSFRHLAQPLLFRSLSFCPFLVDGQNNRVLPKREILERTMAKLQFCSSDRISHAIHTCKVFSRPTVGISVDSTD